MFKKTVYEIIHCLKWNNNEQLYISLFFKKKSCFIFFIKIQIYLYLLPCLCTAVTCEYPPASRGLSISNLVICRRENEKIISFFILQNGICQICKFSQCGRDTDSLPLCFASEGYSLTIVHFEHLEERVTLGIYKQELSHCSEFMNS